MRADARGRALLGLEGDFAERSAADSLPLAQVLLRLHVDDRDAFESGLAALAHGGAPWRGEVRAPPRCLAITAVVAEGSAASAAEAGITGVVQDVTDHRRAARSLERAERARDVIAGSFAHDLRSPAFAIIMAADLLLHRDGVAGDEAVLRRVIASARRSTMKVEELVYFVRLSIGDGIELALAPLDIAALAARCVERAAPTGPADATEKAIQAPRMSSSVRPVVAIAAKGDTIGTWDGSMISAALLTFIENALRHGAPPGAAVDIDGTAKDEVVVSVHNAGVIGPALRGMLFDLVRAPRSELAVSGGLGLGLFNARQIVRAHGGQITVESTQESGTTFSVRLPRSHAAARRTLDDTDHAPLAIAKPAGEVPLGSLQERAPREYWLLLDRYTRLLEVSLHRRTFKNAGESLPDEVGRLADELGALHAGAREVADLHAQALRRSTLMATPGKAQALVTEGRLLSLELMGKLLTYYRRRAGSPAIIGDRS